MKISTSTIERELAALEQSEAVAAPYYLKRELKYDHDSAAILRAIIEGE